MFAVDCSDDLDLVKRRESLRSQLAVTFSEQSIPRPAVSSHLGSHALLVRPLCPQNRSGICASGDIKCGRYILSCQISDVKSSLNTGSFNFCVECTFLAAMRSSRLLLTRGRGQYLTIGGPGDTGGRAAASVVRDKFSSAPSLPSLVPRPAHLAHFPGDTRHRDTFLEAALAARQRSGHENLD